MFSDIRLLRSSCDENDNHVKKEPKRKEKTRNATSSNKNKKERKKELKMRNDIDGVNGRCTTPYIPKQGYVSDNRDRVDSKRHA